MSIETRGHGSELVTDCHGFRQPYDFLVRLKGGDILSPPLVEQRGEAICPLLWQIQLFGNSGQLQRPQKPLPTCEVRRNDRRRIDPLYG